MRAIACASARATRRVARGVRRGGGAAGGGAPAARQGLHRAARAAAGARARACWRSRRTSTAAWPSCKELARRGLVYLANSMNPLRIEGQKTVAHRDRAAVRLGGRPTGSSSRAATSATRAALYAGFKMMRELGLVARMPRLCVAQAANANPMYRAFVAGQGRGRADRRRADAGERHPDRQPGQRAARDGGAARR